MISGRVAANRGFAAESSGGRGGTRRRRLALVEAEPLKAPGGPPYKNNDRGFALLAQAPRG